MKNYRRYSGRLGASGENFCDGTFEFEQKEDSSLSILILIASLASALLLFRLFFLDVMRVDGHSMEPTLYPRQVIFVNRAAYGLLLPFLNRYILRWESPEAGEVVVFPGPSGDRLMVKRCLASEGETIRYLNGYLELEHMREPIRAPDSFFLTNYPTVPQGCILVLGDNLQNSIDSRNFGFIPIDRVIGKAILRSSKPISAGREP